MSIDRYYIILIAITLGHTVYSQNGQPIKGSLSTLEEGFRDSQEHVNRNNQTKYYTNLAGIISPNLDYLGRGEISSKKAKKLKHYQFVYEDNSLLKIQYFDKEQPADNSYYGTHEVRYNYLDDKLIRSYYNANGNKATTYRHYYLGDKIHREVFELDKNNNRVALTLEDSLNSQIESGLGSYVFVFEKMDEDSFLQTQFKKDGSPNILTTYFPFYTAKISTGDNGYLHSISNVDNEGNSIMNEQSGYASIVFDFDDYGNELGWSFKDTSNNLSNRKNHLDMDYGFSRVVYSFSWENQKLGLHKGFEETYFNEENKPVENDKGIHRIKYVYDTNGIFTRVERYNLDGLNLEKD